MGNDLIVTGGASNGAAEMSREDLTLVSDPFAEPRPEILPEADIDKELKAITDLQRTDRKAYNRDGALQARYRDLLAMKEQWAEANVQDRRWKTTAAAILRAVPDARAFEQSYDKLWSNLSELSRDAIRYELALPATEHPARPASEADIKRFAKSDIGAELVKEWGGNAGKRLALIQARAERLLRHTSDEASRWFDELPAPQAKALLKILAG